MLRTSDVNSTKKNMYHYIVNHVLTIHHVQPVITIKENKCLAIINHHIPRNSHESPMNSPAKSLFRATQGGGQPTTFQTQGGQALAKELGYDKYTRDTENQYKMLGNVGKILILVTINHYQSHCF